MSEIRVSKWLQNNYPQLTQRQREEAIERGLVTDPSGRQIKKGDKLLENDALDCTKLNLYLTQLRRGQEIAGVEIIKEGEGFVVVDKPAGVAGHPIGLFDSQTLTQWARYHFPVVLGEWPEAQPTLTPHRLDTGTSGVIIVATRRGSFLEWREKFTNKEVTKTYLAWCWGLPEKDIYSVSYSIAHAIGDKRKMVAVRGTVRFQPPVLDAYSEVQVVKRVKEKGVTLVRVNCSTGVTHQVRVHLASLGFPLLGDKLYGLYNPKRELDPPFHMLRAVKLHCGKWTFSVSENEFTSLY